MKEKLLNFEISLPEKFKTWIDRNPKHARVIPRMLIFMFVVTVGSALVFSPLDFIGYLVLVISFFFFLFFLKFEKMISK